jgi:PAS domain S-box-containing protein
MMQITKQEKLQNHHDGDLLELLKKNVIITITDPLGRITYANENFCAIVGYHEHELIGEINTILKSECDKDPKYRAMWKAIKKGKTWNGTLFHCNNSGEICWLDTTITPVMNHKGQIEKFVAIHKDATVTQEEKNIIADLQFKHSAFVESIPNLVVSINRMGKILSANQGIRNLHLDELIGTYVYGYINPIFHDLVRKNIMTVFNGGKKQQFETMEFDADGGKRYLLSQIGPSFGKEGEIISATISTRDITNIRKVKHDLRDNDAKYQNIFKSIDVGIIVVADDNGNITEWNKGAELAFGYSEDEIIGCHLTQLISQKFRKASMKELISAVNKLKTNRIQETIEMYGLRKDGKEFPVEFALSKWKKGKNAYFCAMMLDISKSKSLENKLKLKTRDLELFLYRSAHDLKAPFSSAEGILNLLKQEEISPSVTQLTSMLDITLQKGKLMIDNLTMAAAISDRNQELQAVNFSNLINEIIEGLSGTINFQFIEFKLKILVHGESFYNIDLLKSIFQNLIQNAIKFSSPPAENFQPTILIEITSVRDDIQILVKDNGKGIAVEHLNKIFELYYRVNTEELPGVGIGLYLVKNIVDDLNGKIDVRSEPSKGTCFRILLPKSDNKSHE